MASEGDQWKRYRKIAAPAFSEVRDCVAKSMPRIFHLIPIPKRNNKLVWDETILVVKDLFENVWGSQHEVVVDHAVDITLPVSQLQQQKPVSLIRTAS